LGKRREQQEKFKELIEVEIESGCVVSFEFFKKMVDRRDDEQKGSGNRK
jgi:hypothetical protein